MATVKVKLRESTVGAKAGVIHYQLCQGRKSQQINSGVRLFPHQWDTRHERVVVPLSDEGGCMLAVQQRLDSETGLLHLIMHNLQSRPGGNRVVRYRFYNLSVLFPGKEPFPFYL